MCMFVRSCAIHTRLSCSTIQCALNRYRSACVCEIEVVHSSSLFSLAYTLYVLRCTSIWPANFNSHLSCAHHEHTDTYTHVNRHAYKHIVCMQWVQYQQHQYRLCACLCLVRTIIWLFLFVSLYFDVSISHSILWNISHTTHASFYISSGKTTTRQRKNSNIRICVEWILASKKSLNKILCSQHTTMAI